MGRSLKFGERERESESREGGERERENDVWRRKEGEEKYAVLSVSIGILKCKNYTSTPPTYLGTILSPIILQVGNKDPTGYNNS